MPTPDFPPNNPYIAGSPLKGQEMFFGRDDIFEKVRANLVGEHQDNAIVIYGQRRTGKTSVLYQMERRLNAAEGRERYVVVLVDLQRFEFKDEDHFLWQLAGTIWRVLRRDYGLTRPERARHPLKAEHCRQKSFPVVIPTKEESLDGARDSSFVGMTNKSCSALSGFLRRQYYTNFEPAFFAGLRALAIHHHLLFDAYRYSQPVPDDPYPDVRRRFADEAEDTLQYSWRHTSDAQKISLTVLALLSLAEDDDAPAGFSQQRLTDYYHKASYTLNHLVRQGLVLEQEGAYTLFSTVFAEWIRHELHNSQTPTQSYQDWLNEPPTQNRLTRLKDSVVDEVTEQLLPAINEKYRELIIEWLTGGAIVEKVIGLFDF